MKQFPFTDYDFWGYLASGMLFLFAVDTAFGTYLLRRETWNLFESIVALSCGYIAGHLLAEISSLVLERGVAKFLIGDVKGFLLGELRPNLLHRILFSSYCRALPEATKKKILEKASLVGEIKAESIYSLAFQVAKSDAPTLARLANFLNQYGFCRNVSVTFFLSGLLFWFVRLKDPMLATVSIVCFFISFGMFLRYLKFYRIYAVEVFHCFAFKEKEKK